ncbi:MAG: hypothetical protein ArsCj_1130 [Arsenophonus endosymbiont of Ceratovacuna japonica]
MNFNSVKFIIKFIIIYAITYNILFGCSTPYHPTTLINKINNNKYVINNYLILNKVVTNKSIPSSPKNIIINNKNINTNKIIYKSNKLYTKINNNNKIIYNRNYDHIQKGSYNNKTYTVKKGDTLFYIAWIIGKDYRDLARDNNITEYYNLNIGQILNINYNSNNLKMIVNNYASNINNSDINYKSNNTHIFSINKKNLRNILSKISNVFIPDITHAILTSNHFKSNNLINSTYKWHWPTEGKIIETFSDIHGGNKGIDISGSRGQSIFATIAGKVVYSGSALRGYGNLIIIKHNDNYLSAYAHNDVILVHDQQEVQTGQKIATMGNSGTNSVKLHFEIRYKGKPVNPLYYLSEQQYR